MISRFRRCGHSPGAAFCPEDQAVIDAFRTMLAALLEAFEQRQAAGGE
ncbi:hypothetical protein [Streptomyces sp. MNP-20]|nr:hypothetical protein [Streptomyces sp. MNP-20]